MKKITLLTIAFISATIMNAQMMADLSLGYGFSFVSSGTTTVGAVTTSSSASATGFYGFGVGGHKAMSEKLSLGARLGYSGGASASSGSTFGTTAASSSNSWVLIEPEFTFYPSEIWRKFYVGPKTAFNFGLGEQSVSRLDLGARVGYMFPASDNFRIGVEWAIGYANEFSKDFTYKDFSGNNVTTKIGGGGGLFSSFALRFGLIFGK